MIATRGGKLGEGEDRVGDDAEFGARDIGDKRSAAGGDEHRLGGEAPVADHDGVGVGEAGATLDDLDSGSVEKSPVHAVEACDLEVLGGDETAAS